MEDHEEEISIARQQGQVKLTFSEWIRQEKKSLLEIVHLIGCDKETVQKWYEGVTIPWRLHRRELDRISNGRLKYTRKVPRMRGGSEIL